MSNPTDVIPVLRMHLDELRTAVDTAYGHSVASDLVQEYRNVGGTTRPSNLTRRLEKALERLSGYLDVEEDEDVSEG